MPPYKNPQEALAGTTALAQPTNDAQRQAIATASSFVPITPSSLTQTQPITPVTAPQQTITTPAFDLTPSETGAEQGVRAGMSDISSLLQDLSGENTYRAEQGANQDLIGKESAIKSYQNQLRSLQSQAQGIDLQLAQRLQTDQAKGGVSAFQLNANQQGTQRIANQDKLTNAIQQYSVGAQLSASQGDYATALQYVDQAVSLKYQGKKDQLAAAQQNLDLLLKSPDLTSAQEKRALARQQIIAEEQRKVAREEKDYETIQGLALQAQQNGAPTAIVNKLANAKDFQGALEYGAGFLTKETDTEIRRYNEAKKTGFKGSFLDYQREVERAKLLGKGTPGGGGGSGTKGVFKNDLDALISNAKLLIPSKFGQENFDATIARARDDSDRLKITATAVLSQAPAEVKNDFVKQSQGVASVDKALALLADGAKTGLIEAGKQYTYNVAGKDFDPNLARLNALITSAIQPYRSSVTGAAWGEQEEKEYQDLFGSTKYTPEALKTRLETLKDILLSKSSGAIYSYASPLSSISGEDNPFDTRGTDDYADLRSQLQGQEVLVQRGNQIIAIDPSELNDNDIKL